jgi:uncharacterized coiled-coil protein SlyX
MHATASAVGRSLSNQSHPMLRRLRSTPMYTPHYACRSPFSLVGPTIFLSQEYSFRSSTVRADAAHKNDSAPAETQTLDTDELEALERESALSTRAEAKLQELQQKSAEVQNEKHDISTALSELKRKLSSLQHKLSAYREEFLDRKTTTTSDVSEYSSEDESGAPASPDRSFLSGFIPSSLHLPSLPKIPHFSSAFPGPSSLPQIIRRQKSTAPADGSEQAAEGDKDAGEVCTADELHYVPVKGTEWQLAMWRYRPAEGVSALQSIFNVFLSITLKIFHFLSLPGGS